MKSKATPHAGARPAKDAKPDVEFVFDFKALNFNSGNAKKDAALKQRCEYFEDHAVGVRPPFTTFGAGKRKR